MKKIIFFVLALLYAILPIDFIPDLFGGLGWIDDLIVLFIVLSYVLTGKFPSFLSKNFFKYGQYSAHQKPSGNKQARSASDNAGASPTPYEILGVSPAASREEIRAAYRRLANQYHPDKVAHLGEEFRQLAETKFKTIQAAYQELTQGKK